MLSLISLGRGLWQKFQTAHPVIRWGGAILVGLVVLEFVAQEAISLYVQLQTARSQIQQANEQAQLTAEQKRLTEIELRAKAQPPVSVKLEDSK